MKLFNKLCVFIFVIVLCVLVVGCGEKDPLEPYYWEDMPENTNPNLEYFGYYHFSTKIDEVASHANTNLAKVDSGQLEEIESLYNNGFYIFIMTRHIFFDKTQPDGLKPDYLDRWETAKENLQPYMDRIIGFYVDEPIWTGKKQEAFHTSCQVVREDFPDKKMMAVIAYIGVMNNSFVIENATGLKNIDSREYLKYCTDVAFDYYRAWDKDEVLNDINKFKENVVTEGQHIWLIPKGFYVVDKSKDVNWFLENTKLEVGEDIKNWIKGSYEIAVEDHNIVGLFCFVYGDDSKEDKLDMWLQRLMDEESEHYDPEVKALYLQIGRAIISNK